VDDAGDGESPSRGPEEATRDLRRTLYLSEALDAALADIENALKAPDTDRALRGVLARHLGLAFDEGVLRENDLKSAVNTLRSQIAVLKHMNRDLLERISKSR